MFAVVVTLKVKDEAVAEFRQAIELNAATSLAQEPGCKQFDICSNRDVANEVFLYELYDDRAAFEAHMATDHFKLFDTQVSDIVVDKSVQTFEQVIS